MLPGIIRSAPLVLCPINVVVDIDVLAVIDVDAIVPVAVPVGVSPGIAPGDADRNADGKGVGRGGGGWRRVIVVRGIGRIGPHTIDNGRAVRGNVDNLGIGRLNNNRLLLHHNLLLLGRLQVPRSLGLLPQHLDGVHHIFLLRQESIADFRGNVELFAHG